MISFSKISDDRLGLYDKFNFGKYVNCRVIDVLDDFNYIHYMQSRAKWFKPEVMTEADKRRAKYEAERHYIEEIKPFEDFDDVPY